MMIRARGFLQIAREPSYMEWFMLCGGIFLYICISQSSLVRNCVICNVLYKQFVPEAPMAIDEVLALALASLALRLVDG